jgi:sRNA-binding regulator protein Hfq
VDLLEKTVKKIENKYKTFGFYDSKEEDFFEKNRQKSVILELYNGSKIQGILEGIDKFRICVKVDDIDKFYFKHAVLCYYAQ